jgi:signal transduction histidine kinase
MVKTQTMVTITFQLAEAAHVRVEIAQRNGSYLLMAVGGILLALMISVIILTSNGIVARIRNLQRGTEIIAAGDLDHQVEIRSDDEISELSRAFNEMTHKLKESYTGLNEEITARKQAEKELTKHREHLEELVNKRTSQLKEKTIELEQVNERLKELDHLKSMFLASMSHELRTPLNSIIGFTGILLQGISGALSDEQKKQLTMVKGSGQHLLDLINDLLDVSKIEAGKVEVFVKEFALAAVANEVTAAISPAANKKKLNVVTKLQDEIVLLSDRRRIKQVLMNLVSNAVKFTDQGQVTITGKRLDNDQVEFEVTDTGIGMKQEDIQRLFQPFQQVGESLAKEHGGTGLGLYLCRKIVDLLHGEIRAESEYGTGSTFTVTLPSRHESGETRRMSEEDSSD